jgi:hypothetical protein
MILEKYGTTRFCKTSFAARASFWRIFMRLTLYIPGGGDLLGVHQQLQPRHGTGAVGGQAEDSHEADPLKCSRWWRSTLSTSTTSATPWSWCGWSQAEDSHEADPLFSRWWRSTLSTSTTSAAPWSWCGWKRRILMRLTLYVNVSGGGDLLRVHQQLQPRHGAGAVGGQTEVSLRRLPQQEEAGERRQAQPFWPHGQAHPEVGIITFFSYFQLFCSLPSEGASFYFPFRVRHIYSLSSRVGGAAFSPPLQRRAFPSVPLGVPLCLQRWASLLTLLPGSTSLASWSSPSRGGHHHSFHFFESWASLFSSVRRGGQGISLLSLQKCGEKLPSELGISIHSLLEWAAFSPHGQAHPEVRIWGFSLFFSAFCVFGKYAKSVFFSLSENTLKVFDYIRRMRQKASSVHGDYGGFRVVLFTQKYLSVHGELFYRL